MDKENQGLNLDQDFVADLGVPFICPNCNELFGNQEYLNQHREICRGIKPEFAAGTDPGVRQSRDPDAHHPHDVSPVPFPASLRSFNFHRSLISSSGSKTYQSSLQRNDSASLPPPYPPFSHDPRESSSTTFHSPLHQSAEEISRHSMQRNDVLLSSTTEKRHTSHLPFLFSSLPPKSPSMNGVAVNGPGPVPCPGCHDIYINPWFLSHHLKYCPKLSTLNVENNAFGMTSDMGQLRSKGPFTCPRCMQMYVNEFYFYQHIENCSGAQQMRHSREVPLQNSNESDSGACPQDQALHQSPKDEQSSGRSVTSTSDADVSTGQASPLVETPEKYSNANTDEAKVDDSSGIHMCQDCGKSFTNKSNLKAHVRTHTGERPFACEECGQRFAHKSNLKKHYSVHTQEKPFDCPLCCASFAHKSGLKLHWRTHTGERPFECYECGQRFSSNSNLKKHVIIHTGEKPFSCKVCGRRYSTDDALQAHAATHSGERNFVCPMCDVAFTHRGGLEAHIRTHTGEKPFPCDYCELTFARRGGLKAHLRTHTGEKPYACGECGLAFAHKSNLNAHYRTHSGEKPFGCRHCSQKFAHKSNLKKHLLTHNDRSFTSSPASTSSDSSCPVKETSAAPPPVISAVTKVTSVAPFSDNCDSKFYDLLDMFEHPSTQALLET